MPVQTTSADETAVRQDVPTSETGTGAGRQTHAPRPDIGAVPGDPNTRAAILRAVQCHAVATHLTPPLSLEEIRRHADAIATVCPQAPSCPGFVNVLINNAAWHDTVASVPFNRRVLLLPQCLRHPQKCRAGMDAFGLLCADCGHCAIGSLQAEAERLGYVTLVAEGTTTVLKLLEQGRVDAVVGVSCLPVMERAFPRMVAEAIPGIAIPLLHDGCTATAVEHEWVRDAIRLQGSGGPLPPVDIESLRRTVSSWFEPDPLRRLLGFGGSATEDISLEWLARHGKRWRPVLAAGVYRSLTSDAAMPDAVIRLAVAVECFHKASLVHDDIEDDDDRRYDEPTVHRQHGIPVALNVGDLLLGEGYRLIASCDLPAQRRAEVLAVAAEGHVDLCLGQGRELCWTRSPGPLSPAAVLEIFRYKTAPAFSVALRFGALCAGADAATMQVLSGYSHALGIGYQIRDDLEDFDTPDSAAELQRLRPSLLIALAAESLGAAERQRLDACCRDAVTEVRAMAEVRRLVLQSDAAARARALLKEYEEQSIGAIASLSSPRLKMLLRRVTGRILGGNQ